MPNARSYCGRWFSVELYNYHALEARVLVAPAKSIEVNRPRPAGWEFNRSAADNKKKLNLKLIR